MTLTLVHASSPLVPSTSTAAGAMIDNVRDECGLLIRGIDWACRLFGFDLVGFIFNPIAGNFSGADQVRMNLDSIGISMTSLGQNYSAMSSSVPQVWEGSAAAASQQTLAEMGEQHSIQGEALGLMSRQVGNMLVATEEVVKVVASTLGMLADELLSVPIAKIAEWVLTGAQKVKRWINQIRSLIRLVETLADLIPPMLTAAKALNVILETLAKVMNVAAVAAHMGAGTMIDDTAEAGLGA